MQNETLKEIESPMVRSKLEGVQEIVYSIDKELNRIDQTIKDQRAVASAAKALFGKLEQEFGVINKKITDGEYPMEIGKIRMDQMKRAVAIAHEVILQAESMALRLEGKKVGLQVAVDLSEGCFNETVGKYNRHKRMFEEDEIPTEEDEQPTEKIESEDI